MTADSVALGLGSVVSFYLFGNGKGWGNGMGCFFGKERKKEMKEEKEGIAQDAQRMVEIEKI